MRTDNEREDPLMAEAAAPSPAAEAPAGGEDRQKVARATDVIREMILRDELPPGHPIRERALAERLGVSRTPMREALKVLAAEGLVELSPHRGASVAVLTRNEIFQILQVLSAVEGFAAELACQTITDAEVAELWALHYEMLACRARGARLGYFHNNQAIHRNIVKATRNDVLIEHHRILNARVYRVRFVCHQASASWDSAIREHEEILTLLEQRNAAEFAPLLRRHVFGAWERLAAMLPEDSLDQPA